MASFYARLEDLIGAQWYVEEFTEFASVWHFENCTVCQIRAKARLRHGAGEKHGETEANERVSYWDYSTVPYHNGFMMLESLRRLEGEETVFRFMRSMRCGV